MTSCCSWVDFTRKPMTPSINKSCHSGPDPESNGKMLNQVQHDGNSVQHGNYCHSGPDPESNGRC